MGLTDGNGQPLTITPEALTAGVTDGDIRTLRRALSENRTLATLAIADATGKLMLDAEAYSTAAESGYAGTRGEYQRFMETASPEVKAALAERLGIENFDATAYEDFAAVAQQYAATPDGSAAVKTAKAARRAAEKAAPNEKAIPRVIGTALADGTYRYGGENGIAVLKEGDTVRIYDYETRSISRPLSVKEANAALQQYRKASESTEASTQEGDGRRYAIKYPSYTESDIRSNMEALADMSAVATVDASKLEKSGKSPKEMFAEYFSSLGGSLYSEEFGDIALGNSSVKSEIRHGLTAEKIASMEAIPSVIEKGRVVFCAKKAGGVERIVVAAPIKIGDANYYMGVMLQRDAQTQYLYLHNVAIEKEMPNSTETHLLTSGVKEENGHLFITSILQNAINVKLQKQKNSSNKRNALPGDGDLAAGESARSVKSQAATREEVDAWALEHVKGYRELAPNERREVRATVRQAQALGFSDGDVTVYAAVAVRSGVRISFSKERTLYTKKDGSTAYSDGFYDPKTNEIVVNPEGKRSAGRLLFHELSHALYGEKRFTKALARAVRDMNADRAQELLDRYREAGRTDLSELSEEVIVHHAEDVLGNRTNLERLVRDEPTLRDKILSFFGVARTEYQGTPRLSRAAGRLYRHFEAALDTFSAATRATEPLTSTNPANTQVSGDGKRYALNPYSEKQKANWKNSKSIIIYEDEGQYRAFIEQSIAEGDFSKKMYFGAIGADLAALIESKTGLNLENFNCTIKSSEIRKIAKEHGDEAKESLQGQRAVEIADFLSIPEVFQKPDNIWLSPKLYNGKPAIHFERMRGNERMTVVAIVSDKHLDLFVQTQYVNVKKGTLATPLDEQASKNTPEASRGTDSTTSIPDSSEKSNPSAKNSSRRDALPDGFDPATIVDRGLPSGGEPLTVGQSNRLRANIFRNKAFSRHDAMEVVNGFAGITERMGDGLLEILKQTRHRSEKKHLELVRKKKALKARQRITLCK